MKYSIISNEKRAILLDRVFKNKEPVKLVALELKLKLPSAKSIVRTYKKTGRIFNKKKTRKSKTRNSQKIEVPIQKFEQLKQKKQIFALKENNENIDKKQSIIQSSNNLQFGNAIYQPIHTFSYVTTVIYPPFMSTLPWPCNSPYYQP